MVDRQEGVAVHVGKPFVVLTFRPEGGIVGQPAVNGAFYVEIKWPQILGKPLEPDRFHDVSTFLVHGRGVEDVGLVDACVHRQNGVSKGGGYPLAFEAQGESRVGVEREIFVHQLADGVEPCALVGYGVGVVAQLCQPGFFPVNIYLPFGQHFIQLIH